MRLAIAILVVAVALSAAVYVHERRLPIYATSAPVCLNRNGIQVVAATQAACTFADVEGSWHPGALYVASHRKPSWEDPVAVLLAIGGFGVAAAILAVGR